jgi:hypothetical protein
VTTVGAAPATCTADKRHQYSSIVQVAGGYFTPIATDPNGWMGLHASHFLTLPPVLPGYGYHSCTLSPLSLFELLVALVRGDEVLFCKTLKIYEMAAGVGGGAFFCGTRSAKFLARN